MNKNTNTKQENIKPLDILYIVIGIILLILGMYHMTTGTSEILNTNTNTNNKIQYNENSDTYTVTIWEDKNTTNDI